MIGGAPARAHARARIRVRSGIALFVYSTGYPLLALALWTGARDGNWTVAGMLVALGVLVSFLGWGLLCAANQERGSEGRIERERGAAAQRVYLALYNRAGAVVVLLGSYAVVASSEGWPKPQTFVGWFALVWVPLFVSFAIPTQPASHSADQNV